MSIRPIFLLKPPKGVTADMSLQLYRNLYTLIANIDIAPTIAEIRG